MVDFNLNGKSVLPKPDAIQQSAVKQAALKQAASGFGNQAGGVASALGQQGGTPNAGCGAGTPTGAAAPAGENPVQGPTTNAPGSLSGPLGGVSPSVQNMVRNSIPSGCRAQVTPNGGARPRDVGGSAHPKGLAVDTNLFCGGRQQFKGSPQMNQYISNLNKNGARGLSYYNSGFVHADLMGSSQRRWGSNIGYVNSATRGENPGPGAAQSAQAGTGGSSGGDPCNPSGGGGCQPIQSSAPQIASGLSQNLGMDVPSMVQGLAGALTGGSPLAAAMSQVTGAVQGALGASGIGAGLLGALPLSPAALTDPTGAITKLVSDKVASMGSSILPSIVGNMPAGLKQASGMVQGLLSDKIISTANQIFSKSNLPQLDKFISVFNAASGAQGFSSALQETIGNTLNNVFGNAGELFQNPTVNNWALRSSIPVKENEFIQVDGPFIGEVSSAINDTINRSQLIGDPKTVLSTLIEKISINAFSTMFYDWDSYVTRGYGTITNNVIEFGTDLKGLGKLADLHDILRIGTPGQIAQQIILNGAGVTIGLSEFMVSSGLTFSDLSDPENDQKIAEFLNGMADQELISYVKEVLEIDPQLNLLTLGDLLNTEKILPKSYEYNYFENLNDIAVFLSMCNGAGRISTLKELGTLLESFEVLYDSSKLAGDPAVYNYEQLTQFSRQYAPVSYFSSDGSLTIADFIGTAAGYIHETTVPRIAEIQNQLYEDTDYFDDYLTLLELLTDAANGNYQVLGIFPAPNTVVIPSTAGYSFGTYTTLDDALSDIVDAIEEELELILETMQQNEDDEALELIRELDSLHTESSMQLAKEYKLRKDYGFKLGSTKNLDQFIGDGTTRVLPLTVDIDVEEDFNVFVSGVWQSPANYTVNAVANTITLNSAPSKGTLIAVNYKTDAFNGIANKMQVWEFASNLENYALETGYGGAADFLRRIVTNDEYGQRITATLMNARNKARSDAYGLNCPNFETVNGANPTYINYINWTGVWTSNPKRAAEIWLQDKQEVEDSNQYLITRMEENKTKIEAEVNIIASNFVRQLIFYNNGNLAISDLMADLYNANQNNEIYRENRDDLFINYSDDLPNDGFILGPYKEILSAITNKENMRNDIFTVNLSSTTEAYLKSINLDLSLLVTIMQRVLTVSIGKYLGISENEFKAIFGVQSVSKSILSNIANNY